MPDEMPLHREVLLPDGMRLHTLVSGRSGTGKSWWIRELVRRANLDKKFGPEHRFIVIDPKGELQIPGIKDKPVTRSPADIGRRIQRRRVVVAWPPTDDVHEWVERAVDLSFAISEVGGSVSFVLDEAGLLMDPGQIHDGLKRLVITGRSRNIRAVLLSQRPVTNRWIDGQVDRLVLFDLGNVDADHLRRRWGFEKTALATTSEALQSKPFSWAHLPLAGRSRAPVLHSPLTIKEGN